MSYATYDMTTRLNARIAAPLARKLAALRRVTRQTTTEVVVTALERYVEAVDRERRPYQVLAEGGLIGCAEGPPDLSTRYKEELSRSLASKVGQAPAAKKQRRRR